MSNKTSLDSYNAMTVINSSTAAYPTTFTIGALNSSTADLDLLAAKDGGTGTETKASNLTFFFKGDAAGSAVIHLAGAADGGVVEHLATLTITFTSSVLGDGYAGGTISVDDTNLAEVQVADSGNSRVCRVALDLLGLRYIKFYKGTLTTTAVVTPYVRYL